MRSKVIIKLNDEERILLDDFSRAVGQSWEKVARFMVIWGLNRHVDQASALQAEKDKQSASLTPMDAPAPVVEDILNGSIANIARTIT